MLRLLSSACGAFAVMRPLKEPPSTLLFLPSRENDLKAKLPEPPNKEARAVRPQPDTLNSIWGFRDYIGFRV